MLILILPIKLVPRFLIPMSNTYTTYTNNTNTIATTSIITIINIVHNTNKMLIQYYY